MFLTSSVLPVLGALGATLPLNITNIGPHSEPALGNLNLEPLPNPFPVPGTDITLQWHQPHDLEDLSKADVEGAFLECKAGVDAHVRFVGDGPIPNFFHTVYRTVIVLFSNADPDVILYSEVSDILMAISWIVSRQGYRESWVGVLRIDGGEDLGAVSVREAV